MLACRLGCVTTQRPPCGSSDGCACPPAGQPEGKSAAAAEPCAPQRQVSADFSAKLALFKVPSCARRKPTCHRRERHLCACKQRLHTSVCCTDCMLSGVVHLTNGQCGPGQRPLDAVTCTAALPELPPLSTVGRPSAWPAASHARATEPFQLSASGQHVQASTF